MCVCVCVCVCVFRVHLVRQFILTGMQVATCPFMYSLVVCSSCIPSYYFFLMEPPWGWRGRPKSTVLPMESLLIMSLHTAADDDSSSCCSLMKSPPVSCDCRLLLVNEDHCLQCQLNRNANYLSIRVRFGSLYSLVLHT